MKLKEKLNGLEKIRSNEIKWKIKSRKVENVLITN